MRRPGLAPKPDRPPGPALRSPGRRAGCGTLCSMSSNHSFKKYFPVLALAHPVLAPDRAGARAAEHLAKGYHHGIGAVGPAQVGHVLELHRAAAPFVGLGTQLGRPVIAGFAVTAEVAAVQAGQGGEVTD